ncbi:MAG: pyridoxal-dependent decarboxylase [Pseudomonadota bacterium]
MAVNNDHDPRDFESLDPEDWEAARATAHEMIDDVVDFLKSVRERPAWRRMPEASRDIINEPIPRRGTELGEVYATFREHILPFPTGNIHPGFYGWVKGTGSLTGALAEFLSGTMNANIAGFDQSPTVVEKQVLNWLAELVDYPRDCSGLLVSGGTVANLNGLAVARTECAGFDVRKEGITQSATRLTVYGSTETHSWIYKACDLMGLGLDAFRKVQVHDDFTIDVQACRQRIEQDIATGMKPFCIVANVGTVNSAAIDDVTALRQLSDDFGLWLHVDGAFGSLAAWSEETRGLVAAQASADSIAFDLHKWGYMPYDIGCVLTRNPAAQLNTFRHGASYLSPTDRGVAVDSTYFNDRGIQLSRSFRALKAWMCMKEQGVDKIGRMISKNVRQAQYLGNLVQAHEKLELVAPVSLNISCLRYIHDSLSKESLNALNEEILLRIQEQGLAVPSNTVLNGRFAIRVCITNHRTTTSDLKALAEAVVAHGDDILNEEDLLPS